ncbi:MAG: hypothetical protein N4A65_03470 [Cohaesibacter sp.]|nr:hypothetical protein [Cohaesibacter sp.]
MSSFNASSSQAFDDLARGYGKTRASHTLLAATQAFVATDLHDKRSRQQYTELVRHFFPKTALEDRKQIAHMLADNKQVPKDVLFLLCCDDERVASIILAKSPCLDEDSLTTQILQGTMHHRKAVAARQDLTAQHASCLLSFGEKEVAAILTRHGKRLPEIARRLRDILGSDSIENQVQTGQTLMEPEDQKDKRKYDALVADMERDWYEHYQPSELEEAGMRMEQANQEALKAASHGEAPSEMQDFADPVPGNQDDDISAAPKRKFSFLIGAEDEDNAPIPAIEPETEGQRSASIQFNRSYQSDNLAMPEPAQAKAERRTQDVSTPRAKGMPAPAQPSLKSQDETQRATSSPSNRITLEIRAKSDPAPVATAAKSPAIEHHEPVAPSVSDVAASEEKIQAHKIAHDEALEQNSHARAAHRDQKFKLGPPPAPFQPKEVEVSACDDDWELALAHLAEPAEQSLSAPVGIEVKPQAPSNPDQKPVAAQRATPAPSIRLSVSGLANAATASSSIKVSERNASISIGTQRKTSSPVADVPKANIPLAPPSLQKESAEIKTDTVVPAKTEPEAVLEAPQIRESVLVVEDVPHGATIEAYYEKASIAKPSFIAPVASHDELDSDNVSDLAPMEAEQFAVASDAKLDLQLPSASMQGAAPNHASQLGREIPVSQGTPIGFMPDMVTFEDLELVEAMPDFPSATDLLIREHETRSTPAIEMIEPDEVVFAEATAVADAATSLANTPAMQAAEQLAAQRNAATAHIDEAQQLLAIDISRDEEDRRQRREALPFAPAALEADTSEQLDSLHINIRKQPIESVLNEAGDLTDLPELAHHRVVEADDFAALKVDTGEAVDSSHARITTGISAMQAPAGRLGSLDQFLGFEEDSRLAIMQSMLATIPPMDRTERYRRWADGRPQLSEKLTSALMMARFAADEETVAQVMHDISGHRRSDMIKLLRDPGGEALVAYLYSIGLDESRTLSMVLHAPQSLSHSYNKISQLMTLFDQMHPAAALAITDQMFGISKRGQSAHHQPMLDAGSGDKAPRLRRSSQHEEAPAQRDATITFGRRTSSR